jgi:hypothetical protein
MICCDSYKTCYTFLGVFWIDVWINRDFYKYNWIKFNNKIINNRKW